MTTYEPGWPLLSVIIPSLARDESLLATARGLVNQVYPDWECLIVLQGNLAPGLAGRLHAEFRERLRLFYVEEPNASLARNIGLQEARGEVVLFLDDDVLIEGRRFLAAHAWHYLDPKRVGVVGQVVGSDRLVRQNRHRMSRGLRNGWLYFPGNFDGAAQLRNGTSCNLSVRRSYALAVGGMDAQFEKGAHREESDFCLRLTDRYGLLTFDPKATLVHLGEPVGGCRNWGANDGIHPMHHVAGEWYFLLKNLRGGQIFWRDLPHHLLALIRRQIFNRANLHSPRSLVEATLRSGSGLRVAIAKLRAGPRYVGSARGNRYREVSVK